MGKMLGSSVQVLVPQVELLNVAIFARANSSVLEEGQ